MDILPFPTNMTSELDSTNTSTTDLSGTNDSSSKSCTLSLSQESGLTPITEDNISIQNEEKKNVNNIEVTDSVNSIENVNSVEENKSLENNLPDTEKKSEKLFATNSTLEVEETDNPEETEKSEETEKLEEIEKPEEAKKSDETEKPEETDTPEETDISEETDKSAETDNPEETEKPEEMENPDETEKLEETGKFEETENSEKPEKSENIEQSCVINSTYSTVSDMCASSKIDKSVSSFCLKTDSQMEVENLNTEENSQSIESKLDDVSKLNSPECETIEMTIEMTIDLQNEPGDESLEVSCFAEEDPIRISYDGEGDKDEQIDFTEDASEKDQLKVVDFNAAETAETSDKSSIDDELVATKGADEELCIIPDTERVISQEEKDAATAAAATAAEAPRANDDSLAPEISVVSPTQLNKDASTGTEKLGDDTATTSTDKTQRAATENTFKISVVKHAQINNATPSVNEFQITEITGDNIPDESCHQCCAVRKCTHKVDVNGKTEYLCGEACVISFRTLNKPQNKTDQLKLKDIAKKMPSSVSDSIKIFMRKCAECMQKLISNDDKTLSWETMDFCNEDCLAKYQNKIGSHCANCKKIVQMSSLGKYSVRFGHDIRQFCCSVCLEEFKKGFKVCSYCQKDISGGSEGFLAPVGVKGQFKDFCTQLCMEKYEQMSNKNSNKKTSITVDISQCSVCNNEKQILVTFEQIDKKHKFCSDPCFVAFKFVNNADPHQCDMCKKYYDNGQSVEFSIYYDNVVKNFCCKTCQNIYIIANRRIVPCSWCKVKKYNVDMIKKVCNNGQVLMMCSLNCLSLLQVSINAVSSKKMKCDHCSKLSHAQYHLTMSDATIRNFCTYHCVMSFQNQFSKLPITLNAVEKPAVPNKMPVVSAGGLKRYESRFTRSIGNDTVNKVTMPVITNVQSLSNLTNGPSSITRSSAVKLNNEQRAPQPQPPTSPKQQIILKAPPLPPMKNAGTMCKPQLHTKRVSCRPHPCSKETQTDEIKEKTILIPVPVPIYVPSPMHMYSAPIPIPIPFPLPIPVPIFIPTTRNSAAGIMKEMKKIQVKIPTDPFEAELLMMAEMVAGEKKVDNTDSESEEDDNADTGGDGGFSPEVVDTSNTFGDDMLQMALKMATELDKPAVDLDGALTVNTITAQQNPEAAGATEEAVDDPQPMHPLMCLKYKFGVNAWKQWVTTKNAELEKSSRRCKLFKNEILQLTADELNYSLCLFVKEVRKPNGTEYAPDTIYYLCLGIQQYLFENGRIDNIFTDAYYEKFTDCLDEVAQKFFVLYNDSHYIVTRVEEEHLWESKQLGAHSPHILLSTLMFLNTKHFNLTTVDEHMQLSFSHIMKYWKRNPNQPGAAKIPGSRNVLLRFYPPQTTLDANSRKKKVYEQQENEENPLRCPVNLYEFYLSKCPESVKTRNDVFYLLPERSCVPDSPVWYSTMALGREALEKMLHRLKMVKEINVALLTS